MPTSDRGLARLFADATPQALQKPPSPGAIGPNAVIQVGRALSALYGSDVAQLLYRAAGLTRYFAAPPHEMLDEREPAALFAAVRQALPAQEADRVLAEAGRRTALYILEHRIPPFARKMLPVLPPGLSSRLLVAAISRHAWTFVGSGRFDGRVKGWRRPVVKLSIAANPLASPGCPWHGAIFQYLFGELCGGGVSLQHEACCARGAESCVTRLVFD